MTACAIRYRLDGPGPAAFLVDCDGRFHVYARGTVGGALPTPRVLALLADRGCRWVPAGGDIDVDQSADPADARAEAALVPTGGGSALDGGTLPRLGG